MIVPIILSHVLPCYPLFILLKGKRFGTQFSNLMGSEWTPPSNPPPPPPAEVEEDDDKLSNSKPTVRKHNPNKSKSSKNAKATAAQFHEEEIKQTLLKFVPGNHPVLKHLDMLCLMVGSTSQSDHQLRVSMESAREIAEEVPGLTTLSDGMTTLAIDQVDAASSNDVQRKSPSPAQYVEVVTVESDTQGTFIIVTKPRADARLGIALDSKEGAVKIIGIEDGSPLGDVLEEGMLVLRIDGTKVTSREEFLGIYDKCSGEVEIMVGPKNMKEAVKIIETLDWEKGGLENKITMLEIKVKRQNREKEGLEKEKTELEARVRKLNLEKDGLDKENQILEVKVETQQRQLLDCLRKKNKTLEWDTNLD